MGPTIFAGFLCLLSGYMAVEAFSFPYRPRLAPLLFSGVTFIFGVVVVLAEALELRAVRRGHRRPTAPSGARVVSAEPSSSAEDVDAAVVTPDPEEKVEAVGLGASAMRLEGPEYAAFGWIGALVVAFYFLGFIVGMSAFMALVMRLYGRESWKITLGVTAGVMGAMYVLFVHVLGVRVYPGKIGALLPLPF